MSLGHNLIKTAIHLANIRSCVVGRNCMKMFSSDMDDDDDDDDDGCVVVL